MDVTKVFKACVKTAKLKMKNETADGSILTRSQDKKSAEASFNRRASEVVNNISKLRDFLFTYQTEYLGEFVPLVSISSKMTDEERQQIDADAQTFMKSCSNAISSLKTEVSSIRSEGHTKSHSCAVLDILDAYLKNVCKLYSQQRAFRVQQALDQKRMARLKPERSSSTEAATTTGDDVNKVGLRYRGGKDVKGALDKLTSQEGIGSNNPITLTGTSQYQPHQEHATPKTPPRVEFSQAEAQMFEEENERLYEELNNIDKEVRAIEGSVVEISRLQEVFQEKVLSQSVQIENINQTSVMTTENVKEGNEQIREAIKNSATFRVWILFFLVMCTFSLLFLDWYND